MPLVTDRGGGFMLKTVKRQRGFTAEAVSTCGFILANGFRLKPEARALEKALAPLKGALPQLRGLHVGQILQGRRTEAFFVGRNFWLSKR